MRFQKTASVIFSLFSLVCFGFILSNNDPKRRLSEIAKEYKSYRQFNNTRLIVTDSSKYKWTIALCVQPNNPALGVHYKKDSLFISKADPLESPHGNKLYRLFIKSYTDYINLSGKPQPIGQVIVKETWNVKEIVYDSSNTAIHQVQSKNDGKWYTPVSASELFIMYKEKENPENDKGWVYGIVDIEAGKEKPVVLYNGKISSCMSCHTATKYDRIFGVK